MRFAIRRCTPDDVHAMVDIKERLRAGLSDRRGGFLLGTDADGYRARIDAGHAWALVEGARLRGFAIGLPDAVFRGSDVWRRRSQVRWAEGFDPVDIERDALAYFDQLAICPDTPGARRFGGVLAGHAAQQLLHVADHLVATTVVEPLVNRAAVPFLERFGGRCVGRVDETHPSVGALVSDVWVLSKPAFEARCRNPVGLAEAWTVRRFAAAP